MVPGKVSDSPGQLSLARDLRSLIDTEGTQVFMLKLSYWLGL
ncbi:MAG: hypothetical protein ACT4O1_08915 [Gemmatimonadota bacterium]